MVDIISYDEALKRTEGKGRTLLVGNGFSIKYFSYKTLLAAAGLNPEDALPPCSRLWIRLISKG